MTQVEGKVQRYEEFLNEKLRGDLLRIEAAKEQLCEEISEYLGLKSTCETLQTSGEAKLKTQIDLGCNFYVKAEVPDCRCILVRIGFGFFLELSWSEAISFVDRKVAQLTTQLDQLELDSAKCQAHIKLVLEGLAELQQC